ncbi:MAG: hypothetical protein IJK24_08370 [Oscillospiraceae bacterium]|nr:hypothetical protein [Oscillospiraceae bacterium]
MATISLYAGKVNQMPELINAAKKSVEKFKTELSDLQKKASKVDSSICNLSEVISSIQASTQTQENRIEALENFRKNSEEFVSETVRIDGKVADTVNQNKKDFYEEYSYLKPDCEKSFLEHLKDAAEWCKDHWREILIVLELVVAVVCLCIPALAPFGALILETMLKGFLIGLISGAVIGGISGYAQYGVSGILGGMLQGAENGALMGLAFGGLGGVGALAGSIFGCSALMTGLFYGSSVLSFGMLGFDGYALAYAFQTRFQQDTGINLNLVDPNAGKLIFELNQEAHSHEWYNTLQLVAGGTAAFSGGYISKAACFVAGTLVATVDGLKPIETLKVGDMVLSIDIDTMHTDYKPVLETYIRKVRKLVYLKVDGEVIVATEDHPFYVSGQGFVNAAKLIAGARLVNLTGGVFCVEQISFEYMENGEKTVYNLQIADNHTYCVGNHNILVHNAGAEYDTKTVETGKGKEEIPVVKKQGSPSWKKAVSDLKEARGKGNNFIAQSEADAEMLINEARPDLTRSPTYDPNAPKSNYQIHPIDNEYGMPHIKFQDWANGKQNGSAGHIFWEGK